MSEVAQIIGWESEWQLCRIIVESDEFRWELRGGDIRDVLDAFGVDSRDELVGLPCVVEKVNSMGHCVVRPAIGNTWCVLAPGMRYRVDWLNRHANDRPRSFPFGARR